ncbi:MAG: hypothetical protein CMH56_09045 [Myxococcales bacterium]|nr:hypothetical protein [Myxococcales bacterium]|tara:strand:- start:3002 stop:4771 length:1770 start_codon:yes stop_codon:yes gene_type:complete
MTQKIRFGDYVHEVSVHQYEISYNDLAPKVETDASGEMVPVKQTKLALKTSDMYHLLKPYLSVRFMDQVRAVVPLAVYLFLFQIIVLRQAVQDSWMITGGLFAVIIGLMLFMEGLTLGLMPFGETIGKTLPVKSPLPVVLLIAFLLGVSVTFAEPAIGALQQAGKIVDVNKAPYLYALLNEWATTLVLMVGAGVGIAAVLGTMRFLRGWSLKPMIYMALTATISLSAAAMFNPDLRTILGLAWDCGAVTTGPVTVPLVLSLGIGVASSGGKGESSLSGFGIVTLASLFPIMGVLILSLYLGATVTPESIIAGAAGAAAAAETTPQWYEVSPGVDVVLGVRAIVPLVIFLFLVMKVVLREKIRNAGMIAYGIVLAVVGMCTFNVGLTYGLAALGGQSGGLIPAAFVQLSEVQGSPLYSYGLGIGIAFIFAWILGFGATLAEPALNALGMTVQNLTNGAFKKSMLMYSVSFGVAFGIGLGVIKLIFGFHLAYLLVPFYCLGVVLTIFSTEEFVNVAWDSAGVTTGPVTVPLVLAMGLGFGNAVSAIEGFGILSMASICPICAVLSMGLIVQAKAKKAKTVTPSTEPSASAA